jgi:hypothetical protein
MTLGDIKRAILAFDEPGAAVDRVEVSQDVWDALTMGFASTTVSATIYGLPVQVRSDFPPGTYRLVHDGPSTYPENPPPRMTTGDLR